MAEIHFELKCDDVLGTRLRIIIQVLRNEWRAMRCEHFDLYLSARSL
jgi:hypothetical protein